MDMLGVMLRSMGIEKLEQDLVLDIALPQGSLPTPRKGSLCGMTRLLINCGHTITAPVRGKVLQLLSEPPFGC